MKPVDFDFEKSSDIKSALETLGNGEDVRKVISGGQSMGPMLNLRLVRPDMLVDVTQVRELCDVLDNGASITYGAATRHAAFEDAVVPDAAAGMMRSVASGIAYRAVRNRGTIGGSLAHADPAADWVTTTVALDAQFTLRNKNGQRNVAASAFFLGAFTTALGEGEIIESVTVPKLTADAAWGYYKICRKVGEFADASAAVVVDPKRQYCRVVMGALDGAPVILEDFADTLATRGRDALADLKDIVHNALPDASPVAVRQHEVALRRAIEQVYPS